MPIISTGTPVTARRFFNSGYITLGTTQLVDVQDISINLGFDSKELKALNSIVLQAIRRANFKVEVTFNASGNTSQLTALFFSSSSPSASGQDFTVYDGQPTASTFLITGYVDDSQTKGVQYQIANAMITKSNTTKSLEGFEMTSYTVVGTNITKYEATLAAS